MSIIPFLAADLVRSDSLAWTTGRAADVARISGNERKWRVCETLTYSALIQPLWKIARFACESRAEAQQVCFFGPPDVSLLQGQIISDVSLT